MQRQHFLRNMKKYSGTVSVRRRIPDLRRSIVRRLISTALGIVMIILSGCSFSVPVREEESIDSTAIVRAERKTEWNTEQTERDRDLCSRLWMCEEAGSIFVTFWCENAGGDQCRRRFFGESESDSMEFGGSSSGWNADLCSIKR